MAPDLNVSSRAPLMPNDITTHDGSTPLLSHVTTLIPLDDFQASPTGLVDYDLFELLMTMISQGLLPIIELFGLATNTINLIVFTSMGLSDCVNVSFFSLALSDLLYLMASFVGWFSPIMDNINVIHRLNLFDFSFIVVWYAMTIMAVSNHITTYIAIQRCCCVALPLQFKGVFTTRRNVITIVTISMATVALHVPILSKIGMKPYFDVDLNISRIGVSYAEDYGSILKVKDFVSGLWLPIITQGLTVGCMFILLTSLRKSSRFRQQATSSGKEDNSESTKTKYAGKELQVVKAVTVVTLMFVVCNVVPIAQAVARRVESGFGYGRRYQRIYMLIVAAKHAVQHLNASLNMFVYLKFNSGYRKTLARVLWFKDETVAKSKTEN